MAQTATQPQREIEPSPPGSVAPFEYSGATREEVVARLRLLWIRRRFLLRTVAVGFLMATLLAFLMHERFESTTRLMPPDSQASGTFALMAGLAGQSGALSGAAGDLLGIKSTGALFVGVLQSRTVQDRIIDHFDLKNVYGLPLEQTARQLLEENTGISEDRKSGIITLTVTDRDPKRAALIAGAYVEELNALMAQLTTSSAHRERVFLEERLNAVKQDLESAEKDFSQFASKNAAVDITEQGKAMVGAAATLDGQLIAAQSELEGLRQIYTDNNVRVRTVQARIAELRNQLQKLDGKSANATPSDAPANSEAPYPTLRQLPVLGVPYEDKFRQLKIEEAVFETLTKEFELAKVQEAKEIPTVKVLDPPEVPEKKSYPPRLLIMFLGTIFTMTLAVAWVVGVASWHEIDPDDPRKLFAREVLGTLPRIPWGLPSGAASNAMRDEFRKEPGVSRQPGS